MGVQEWLGQGVSKVKSASAAMLVEQRPFVRGFVRMCTDGWNQGWHERNGGNASYRMTFDEACACRPYFYQDAEANSWTPLGAPIANLAGECFLVTGTGSYMRNIEDDVAGNIGIVEVDGSGSAYRVVWGLRNMGRPTSEFAAHLMIHSVKKAATDGACRVLYHCHPVNVVALGAVLPPSSREVSRALWKTMTECIMVFPEGVGVTGILTPGGYELACATARLMERHNAVIWARHGLMASGSTFDEAFGLAHVVVKAADMYRAACAMCAGPDFRFEMTDDELRRIASDLGVVPNPEYI